MRLEPVIMPEHKTIHEMLQFYMGKNTPERQTYIVENLRVEHELEFSNAETAAAEPAIAA